MIKIIKLESSIQFNLLKSIKTSTRHLIKNPNQAGDNISDVDNLSSDLGLNIELMCNEVLNDTVLNSAKLLGNWILNFIIFLFIQNQDF